MLGGQAYALRDDLNRVLTTAPAVLSGASATYSSQPFVLLDYFDSDLRPKMRAFKVLREKLAAGIVFDYVVTAGGDLDRSGAGRILQAPMPLPFLPPPVDATGKNYNTEPFANSGDLPTGWNSSLASGVYSNYARFTYRDRKENFWVLRGLHAGLPSLRAGTYNLTTAKWMPPTPRNSIPRVTAMPMATTSPPPRVTTHCC